MKTPREVEELREFLASKEGCGFNFRNECLEYCSNDVLVLFLAGMCLEMATLKQSNYAISFICSTTFTLAGFSALFFRALFLKPQSIGRWPPYGYTANKSSLISNAYFRYINEKRAMFGLELIRHARSKSGEHYWTRRRSVDGMTSRNIYEFEGERIRLQIR